ncbi:MAG: hypothetical protein J0I21_17670, partial [Alphaproteobacteria bacterium]|nr:hypothetical protein [Alphaproteobacteria bacterium]
MAVPVMQVGIVRMAVHKPCVPMCVHMRLAGWVAVCVRVLVVRIMHMRMLVYDWLVDMLVLMVFEQMDHNSGRHQHSRAQQPDRGRLAEQRHRDRTADEGRGREI